MLCGWLAVLVATDRLTDDVATAVRSVLDRTTLLSATLVECALHGEVLPEFAAYLAALGTPARGRCRPGPDPHRAHVRCGALVGRPPRTDHARDGGSRMRTHVELRSGAYADSVTLLQVSRDVAAIDGVLAAQVAMATPLNVEVLGGMGFDVPASSPNDMVVALRADDDDALDRGLAAVDRSLTAAVRRPSGPTELAPHRTSATALRSTPGGLVLVSTPGASATVEAMDALDAGADVMLFSDNVPVEQEIALKRVAADRGLLVMGPDCGTAVVGGLGLGFANVVRPGPVGIVAASGTGCQQLLTLLDHAGVGVTSALGVGGRDLSAEVGGLATREALRRLDVDETVELIVLVSKPPAPEVAAAIESYVASLGTPVELALLGPGRPDLTAATEAVLRRLGRDVPTWPVRVPGRRASRRARDDGCTVSSSAAPTAPRHGSSPRSCWGPTGATPSPTSATTPTPPAAPIR